MKWIRVAHVHDIPLREGRAVEVLGREIALFNLGDRFVAVENRCPHRGGPLSDGIVSGGMVVCPLHSWKVCLSTGAVNKPQAEACVETYPTRIEDGVVLVQVDPAGPAGYGNQLTMTAMPQTSGPNEAQMSNAVAL
ncbi:MAG TPA: nitrite reductase small subunit NirD [Terriglobia bacterium]|nr:nitrite reductase small subunit NirD [Terriglobia bacterium]